ncbi:phosphatase PAP2 family protein [Pontibacter chitinilyticus]|uniref:phosphatase PAP2 family protein n=1 Tax=Pontibacter chitinilyticus TaxID=2674989 RepID=UPI00321A4E0C
MPKLLSLRVLRPTFLLTLVLSACNPALAQTPAWAVAPIPYPNTTALQETVPVKPREPHRLWRGAAIAAAGAAAWTLTFAYVDELVQQFMQSHRCAVANGVAFVVQPLGRQQYLMPAAGVSLVAGELLKDKKLQQAGLLSVGSILINAGLTSTIKNAIHRHRPSATTENHEFDQPFRPSPNGSLPSSHTSTAFAVATSQSTMYHHSKYVPPMAYGVATLVGLSRINDNAHWVTDVMAGAAVGFLSAKGVHLLYNLADKRLKNSRQPLLLTPQVGLSSAQISGTFLF